MPLLKKATGDANIVHLQSIPEGDSLRLLANGDAEKYVCMQKQKQNRLNC